MKKVFSASLMVVCLGYFADAFDLFLYNAVRVPSLTDMGLSGSELTREGLWILNLQVAGMFLGGFLWGSLGDRVGRKKALIGSVLLYSLGSIGCALVHNVDIYAAMRFLTGFGLAGELGLGAVLITETLQDRSRDWGIVMFMVFGNIAILSANALANIFPWRTCYAIGGVMGFLILMGRMALMESGLYERVVLTTAVRGSMKLFFRKWDLLKRWLLCVFFTMPYFFTLFMLVSLAPEFGEAMGVSAPVKASTALVIYPACVIVSSFLCVWVSRLLQKRKLAITLFMAANAILSVIYLTQHNPSQTSFYALCGMFGLLNFFTLLLFTASEQFGTNMRGTAGTSALSSGRATLVITNSIFLLLRSSGYDLIHAAEITGVLVFIIGFACLLGLRETYHQNMDFIEEA